MKNSIRKILILCLGITLAIFTFACCNSSTSPQNSSSSTSSVNVCENGHIWGEISRQEPTCQSTGEIVYECSNCLNTYTETLPVGTHVLGEKQILKRASLEKKGEYIQYCTGCGSNYYETEEYSFTNDKTHGIDKVELVLNQESYLIGASYQQNGILFALSSSEVFDSEKVSICLNPNGATELVSYQAVMLTLDVITNTRTLSVYTGYSTFGNTNVTESFSFTVDGESLEILIPYSLIGTEHQTLKQTNLAFYPKISVGGLETNYTKNNSFVLDRYAETWLALNQNNYIYYDNSYQSRNIANWTRPSFANHDSMFVGVIKETTVEGAIVAIAISEAKGASGFDLHLNYLFNNGLLTKENIEKIAHSTSKPILALNYNGDQAHQDRTDGLMIGVQGGCAAVDMQGFIYWSGSTLNTHTAENVAYWENKGYDMCFISASPKETVLDVATVELQLAFIQQVHNLGAEVLISTHISTVFNAKQAVAYAEFCAGRGVDVVKIVGLGYNKLDVQECVQACIDFQNSNKLANTKVSYHLSGDKGVYISRVICPSFYKSYVAFCWPELTS